MDSRPLESARFALAIVWRALLIAGLGAIMFETVVRRQYASAAVALAVIAIVAVDLARHAGRTDRLLSQFIGNVAAAEMEWPAAEPMPGLARLKGAMRQAHAALAETRARQHGDTEYLRALVDTAAAALFTFDDRGPVPANRAAHQLVERGALDIGVGGRLAGMAPGERQLVRLAAGQRALATATRFNASAQTRTVVALQTIERELDAAEIRAWQDLARILAHEMMNSLTPVASLAQSLKPLVAGGSRDVADAVEVIGERSQHLMRFVERYRAAAELPVPVLAAVRVADLFAAVETLLRGEMAGVDLTRDIMPAGLTLMCDRALMEQALINLVRNAADAVAGQPGGRIALIAGADEDQVSIAVTDNGPGLSPDLRERVFVPFFTTKPGGSGIGLSLVRQIAVAHGGRAEAQSDAAGTTIRLCLPVSPVGTPDQRP